MVQFIYSAASHKFYQVFASGSADTETAGLLSFMFLFVILIL